MKRGFLILAALILVAAAIHAYASGRVWSEVTDNVAYVHHDDAYFNCCPEMVFEIKQHCSTIDIYEQDTLPGCRCMCYYNFIHTFEGLAPGTYLARVWERDDPGWEYKLAGTTSFTIPTQVGFFSTATAMSECHMEPESVNESSPDNRGIELENVSLTPSQKSVGVRYHLPAQSEVTLEIYDVTGTKVRTLAEGFQDAGDHIVVWDIRSDLGELVSRGVYLVRLETPDQIRSLPLIILR